ncbi:histone-lysine N-methyltransferase SETMAR [Plakobranchus ocellatus]|uniref:Histone-lysine N-methyltransferase SETMAR n=1 Tax=Plakobranchus ocellatus TaxID=259542 RepID=A0AAV4ACH6_9GAST|nr:histone-lysine N-methyltransferase SETMAR [Plakobranchus ocellatus]
MATPIKEWSKPEVSAVVRFLFSKGTKPSEFHKQIAETYGEGAMSRSRVYQWCTWFGEGRTSLDDEPKSGRPKTSTNEENTTRVFTASEPLRIGYYVEDGCTKTTPAVHRAVNEAKKYLESAGHRLIPYKPPDMREVMVKLLYPAIMGSSYILWEILESVVNYIFFLQRYRSSQLERGRLSTFYSVTTLHSKSMVDCVHFLQRYSSSHVTTLHSESVVNYIYTLQRYNSSQRERGKLYLLSTALQLFTASTFYSVTTLHSESVVNYIYFPQRYSSSQSERGLDLFTASTLYSVTALHSESVVNYITTFYSVTALHSIYILQRYSSSHVTALHSESVVNYIYFLQRYSSSQHLLSSALQLFTARAWFRSLHSIYFLQPYSSSQRERGKLYLLSTELQLFTGCTFYSVTALHRLDLFTASTFYSVTALRSKSVVDYIYFYSVTALHSIYILQRYNSSQRGRGLDLFTASTSYSITALRSKSVVDYIYFYSVTVLQSIYILQRYSSSQLEGGRLYLLYTTLQLFTARACESVVDYMYFLQRYKSSQRERGNDLEYKESQNYVQVWHERLNIWVGSAGMEEMIPVPPTGSEKGMLQSGEITLQKCTELAMRSAGTLLLRLRVPPRHPGLSEGRKT